MNEEKKSYYTIADGQRVVEVEGMPNITDGWIDFEDQRREVREINQTSEGVQIELI